MKLKTKFLIIFLLISNIPIIIITAFTYDRYVHLIREQINQVSTNIYENALDECNATIDNINKAAEMFQYYSQSDYSIMKDLELYSSSSPELKAISTPEQWAYHIKESNDNMNVLCQNIIYSNHYINGIFVFTPSGVNLGYGSSNTYLKYEYVPTSEDWYINALSQQGKVVMSNITVNNCFINEKESITFSKALYDVYSRDFLGVMIIDCSPDLFNNLSSLNTLPETILLSIENNNGYNFYNNLDTIDWIYDGRNTTVLKSELEIESLTLTAAINYDKLYDDFGFTRILIIGIAVMCAFIFIVTAFILSKYLTKPITGLSTIMSTQKMNQPVSVSKYLNRTDEIGILYNEYNNMLDQLNEHIKSHYQNKLITLDSQMKSLEAQINSHFLYNTLESINSIAELEEIESISTMALALGNMFRYSIKTKSELVTIREELSHVNDYTVIQRIRFDDRFHLDINISPHMYDLKVLKLIIQPIVENALYHGLGYCKNGDRIVINGSVSNQLIVLEIIDNGKGMETKEVNLLQMNLSKEAHFTELGQRNKESIGLKNIHTRIALYYGQGYGLSISSKKDEGTRIQIKIPLI